MRKAFRIYANTGPGIPLNLGFPDDYELGDTHIPVT